MKLYHGTSFEAAAAIRADGFLAGPVFLTPNRNVAEDYAADGVVFEVYVDDADLMIDLDMPGARLLAVEYAAEYLGDGQGGGIDWFISRGYSVGVNCNVDL